ncbi:MAG: Mur ligase family protein [Candidatus Caenarcaniphilales bacterium]|nr:Mur ligase family protein [Candidatus Caenarcaniphilales bacterium]
MTYSNPINHKGPDPQIELGLKNIKSFLSVLGNPQDTIQNIVHVAGTNGKGSTIAFLESLLTNLAFKVGKYTSPHLINLTERYQINGEQITKEKFNSLFNALSKYSQFATLTHFEKLTAIAFQYFAEQNVDLLLLETGLGGRLDATNCIKKPILSLITNIGHDHQDFLGDTLQEISKEKAGILKPNIPFMTTAKGISLEVIVSQAQRIHSPQIELRKFILDKTKLGLKGSYQEGNAQLALNAFKYIHGLLNPQLPFKEDSYIETAIYKTQNWPGRFEIRQLKNKNIILDGAHNKEAANGLKQSLDEYFPKEKRIWLLGFLKNKDYREFLNQAVQKEDSVIFTFADTEVNSVVPKDLVIASSQIIQNIKISTNSEIREAFESAKNQLLKEEQKTILVVSGSLYLVGKVMELISESED